MKKAHLAGSGIWRRAFLFIASGMLVVLAAFSVLFFGYFRDVLRERIGEDQRYAISETGADISTVLTNVRQNAYYLCIDQTLASLVTNQTNLSPVNLRQAMANAFSMDTGPLATPLMQSAYAMLFIDRQFPFSEEIPERFSLEKNYMRSRVYSARDVDDVDWYRETMARSGQIYAFRAAGYNPMVCFAHQLRSIRVADPRYNEILGAVLYTMPESRLIQVLGTACITDHAVALLLFGDSVFLSTDPDAVAPGSPAGALLSLPGGAAISPYTLNDVAYTASGISFQGDWKCVLLIPDSDVYDYIKAPMSMLLGVTALFLLIAGVVSFAISARLARPIVNLSNVMAHMDSRYLPQPVLPPDTQDEIALLYGSYNMMTVRIAQLLQQETEEAEKLRQAELRAMQAQINPHFIYNTLDSISCSALMEGNDEIVTMVDSLISILKYSVNFSRPTASLGEEIEYLQHYIRIQQLRFKEGFRFSQEVPSAYHSVPVAQIILQPLVENALFHARNDEEPLDIRLFCREDGDMLEIIVRDNGAGDPDALNALLASPDPPDTAEGGHGIGIRNVNRRLRLQLGERSGLHYARGPQGGLDAVVRVPLKFGKNQKSNPE